MSESKSIMKRKVHDPNTPFLTGLSIFIINSILIYGILTYASNGIQNHNEWKECTFQLFPAVITFIINAWIAHYAFNQVRNNETSDKAVIDNVLDFYKNPKNLVIVAVIIAISAYVSISCANAQKKNPKIEYDNMVGGNKKGISLNDISDDVYRC